MDLHNRPRRFELRDETSQAHSDLDTLIGTWKTQADYHRYVVHTAAFRIPVEQALSGHIAAAPFKAWSPQVLTSELEQDLSDLALPLPAPLGSPEITNRSEALGVAYVMEGSSLGAKLLIKRANELGFTESYGARHLAEQASSNSWRHFLAVLEGQEGFDLGQAAAAARATFALALKAFEKEQP